MNEPRESHGPNPTKRIRALAFAGGGFDTAMQLGVAHALLVSQSLPPDHVVGLSAVAAQPKPAPRLARVVGNDEGEVVLLDKTNGKVVWRCRLEKKAEIKSLVAETDEGFFVSSGDSYFWLVSRDGKLLLRCNDFCAIPK